MDKIRVFFILPHNCKDETEVGETMLQAFELCKQNAVNVSWIEEAKFDTNILCKTDFVVFEDFKSTNFESLKESKCARIVGPWCVLVCLMEGRPIPNFIWPIYNVAMSNCVISCSHLPKTKKQEIKEKVQLMGGCYTDTLMSTNTHLITTSVKSEKYLLAAEAGSKLMLPEWVDAVWEASQSKNVHCNDEEFNKYRCLPFYNLIICSTGCSDLETRKQLAQNVAQNGGVFTGTLTVTKTDILVVFGEDGCLSKKYKAARTNPDLYCVTIDWINDSIAKGYALPHNLYNVKKYTSTPTKDDVAAPNFSMMSVISDINVSNRTTVDESVISKNCQPSFAFLNKISPNKRKSSTSQDLEELIDGLDIKRAKKAGQFLDGCSIYVAGFKPDQREKLCKILNLSGATRYDDISDRLTHVIVGDSSSPEVKLIKSKNYPVCLVSIHWLLDSMEKQQPMDEENYLINLHSIDKEQFNSPLGQKGLNLLRSHKTLTPGDLEASNNTLRKSVEGAEVENDLMQQYLKTASRDEETDTLARLLNANSNFDTRNDESKQTTATTDNDISTQNCYSDRSSECSNLFYSNKFLIVNFPPEDAQFLKEQIESVFGVVMPKTYKGIPDFVVAPMFVTTPIQISALEIVNNLWVVESIQEGEKRSFMYYHRPFVISDNKPLESCVVTISGYSGYERTFLKELIEVLGGVFQEQFARVTREEKNILASTHLVSLEADGKKYMAALKWKLPVVNKDWLFECAQTGKLVSEEKFLMGESQVSSIKTPSSSKSCISGSKISTSEKRSTPQESQSKTNRILTPLNHKQPLNISATETPVNQRLFKGVVETPDGCSQITPVNKLMEEVRRTNLLGTPQTPPLPKSWYNVDTPPSPFGAAIKPHMSPKSKKELMRYINCIPDFVPVPKDRRLSTPLSEVKRRCWKKLLGQEHGQSSPSYFPDDKTQPVASGTQNFPNKSRNSDEQLSDGCDQENCDELDANPEDDTQNLFFNTKLKEMEDLSKALGENRRRSIKAFESAPSAEVSSSKVKDSQPFTVGWDYTEGASLNKKEETTRIFIISGVENDVRQSLVDKIESLGAHVSDLNSYDPKCTHLLCSKPARNEKTLACMAAGKWILHISYVDKSIEAGKFLNEEEFEFGNPKSKDNIKISFDSENEARLRSIHWWRKEISKRGFGAFNDFRTIVVAQKREPIIRVIEAGGGQVVNISPPFEEPVHATHCLLEIKSVRDFSVYNPLAEQGILCINTLYISDYLYRTNKDIKDAILPHFSRFYEKT